MPDNLPPDCLPKQSMFHSIRALRVLKIIACYAFLTITLSGCSTASNNKFAALQITSNPQASVFLDGKHIGKTPFYSDQIKAGDHTVKITASKAIYIDKITLTPKTLTVLNRDLADNFLAQSGENLWLEPGLDKTIIISRPAEADITIDGIYFDTTPKLISDLKEGEHKVQLSKNGFIEREFTIKTSSSYRLVANVTLASQIARGQAAASIPLKLPKLEQIEIMQTPQGFLRVRKEPTLTSSEVGRVNTGDKLEVIQEVEDWVKINFSGKQGWVSEVYTKKIE